MMHRHRTVSDINGSLLLLSHIQCVWPCPPGIWHRALVLLSWVIEEINGGWSAGSARLLVCSLPAFIRVPRMWTPWWWRDVGRRVQVNGGSLSLVQDGIFRFITGPNSRMIASQTLKRERDTTLEGHLREQLIHLGALTELGQNMIPSLINVIIQLICIFSFPVRGRAARHRWCMEETPQIEKLYSWCYLCPPSFHCTSVSIISSVNVQSLCTSPHDGVDCNCLQMHCWCSC